MRHDKLQGHSQANPRTRLWASPHSAAECVGVLPRNRSWCFHRRNSVQGNGHRGISGSPSSGTMLQSGPDPGEGCWPLLFPEQVGCAGCVGGDGHWDHPCSRGQPLTTSERGRWAPASQCPSLRTSLSCSKQCPRALRVQGWTWGWEARLLSVDGVQGAPLVWGLSLGNEFSSVSFGFCHCCPGLQCPSACLLLTPFPCFPSELWKPILFILHPPILWLFVWVWVFLFITKDIDCTSTFVNLRPLLLGNLLIS